MVEKKLKIVDLFCGAGGWSTGLELAGHEIIWAVDNWEEAIKTYKINHPNSNVECLDINEIKWDNEYLQEADIIVGSPPCKSFSQLNKTREYDLSLTEKFLELTKDRFFVMENVTNIKKKIKESNLKIQGNGYILSLGKFGVPQVRRRYIHSNILDLEPYSNGKIVKDGDVSEYISMFIDIQNDEDSPNHRPEIEDRMSEVAPGKQHPDNTHGVYYRIPKKGLSQAIVNVTKAMTIHPNEDRRLTVNEAKILQTFPIDYIFYGTISQQAEMIGNAVPPRFAEEIGKLLTKKVF